LRTASSLTTDGFRPYVAAVDPTFGSNIDFAMLVKVYAGDEPNRERYSPSEIMQLRRFTRLTNAFSKKLANMKLALALHFAYYNFCLIHSTLRVTPAMVSGLTDKVWDLKELAA
jgi:hypothetical protein